MKLHTSLFVLVAGTGVPLLALAAVLAYFLLAHEATTFRDGTLDRNRALISAVDAEIRGHFTSLRALAASRSLEQDDLAAFHAEAARVVGTHGDWGTLVLSDANGQQLVNTRLPFGAPLPKVSDRPSFDAVVRSARPTVGSVSRGPHGNYHVPMRLPIVRDGAVKYVLTAAIDPRAFLRLIEEQQFPAGWAAALLDASGRFVARVPERLPGELASADLRAALGREPEGWYRGTTLEGMDTFTAHRTSGYSNWAVGVAVPAPQVFAAAWRTAAFMSVAALLLLGLAVAFAYVMGRRIAAPIAAVAARARALARGHPDALLMPAQAGIEEVRSVEHALAEAGDAVLEREALRDREENALKAADKAKDEFLAMLGHELRNPLSAITASAHVLRLARPGDASATRAHAVIERQARQMTRLVEDLLDVSRLTMGKVTLELDRFDLAEIVQHAATAWREAGDRSPGRLELSLSSACVHADRARIEQVVSNLLDNADKFSPAGMPVTVRVERRGARAVLEVADRGEGIAPAMLARIFDPFVQAPQDLARARGGMGLGLALVRRLVELHGGSVDASSEGLGHGATFVVTLPAVEQAGSHRAPSAGVHPAAVVRRILVVEDNDDARVMLATMLELEGHVVRAVADGLGAVECARDWQPEVGIVDIGLPDIDGYELARRLRAPGAHPGLRLVALSGYGQSDDARRAYEAGFDLHLTKPVDPAFLRDVLVALVPGEGAIRTAR
jgi:signal transduction histidine kinase/ActR/RegA family two-component response regulator